MVYVMAGAWAILLLVKNPYGEHGLLDRLKGEIISISNADLGWTLAAFAVVVLLLLSFQKEFMLASFDREMAITLKKSVLLWDALLFLLIGLTISMAVLSVGPLVTFGFPANSGSNKRELPHISREQMRCDSFYRFLSGLPMGYAGWPD